MDSESDPGADVVRCEVPHVGRGFDPGGFYVQRITTVPGAHLILRLGVMACPALPRVEDAVRRWLALS